MDFIDVARLSIQLPDDLRSKVQARADEAGHASVEAYVEALLRADVEAEGADHGAPPHLSASSDAELEALLLQRLEDTELGIEASPAFWDRLHEEARARRERGPNR